MRQLTNKNELLCNIKDLVRSFYISLLEISNKFFNDYNYEVEKQSELTIIGLKGHLESRQEEDMVVFTMGFEYSILKEPYSKRKEAHEIKWHTIQDQEISFKGTIRQMEKKFDYIKEEIEKLSIFRPKLPIERKYYDPDEIEVDVKIGSKFFSLSTK